MKLNFEVNEAWSRGRDALSIRDINLGIAGQTRYDIRLRFAKC